MLLVAEALGLPRFLIEAVVAVPDGAAARCFADWFRVLEAAI